MRHIVLFFCALGVFGCNSTLEEPDSVPVDEILQITVDDPTLSSGGSRTRVIARTPKDGGVLDVTFTTTAGIFLEANAKTIKELTDSIAGDYRYASTVIVSDITVGKVYITAEAKTMRRRIEINFN